MTPKGKPAAAALTAAGVVLRRDEHVEAFGTGWLLRDKGGPRGFAPCPWAFDVARFSGARPGDRVLDLGTGGGVLLVALSQLCPDLGPRIGLELDGLACQQAAANARLNGGSFSVVQGDVRERPIAPRAFDVVISNPPFYRPGWGRQSGDPRVHASTHALHGDIGDFCAAAAHALAPHGQVAFVYDAQQLAALLLALAVVGLTARQARFLRDDRGLAARVLILAGRGGGGLGVDAL